MTQYINWTGVFGITWARHAGVWVLGLGIHDIAHSVLKAIFLPPTIAPLVFLNAINALLLWKLHEAASLDEMSSLHSTYGRECPAWSASTLVLDWSDRSFLYPIHGIRNLADVKLFHGRISSLVSKESSKLWFFESSPVRELVVAKLVSDSWSWVPLIDLGVDISIDGLS